jgi:thiamine pyrophosphate-dependent acetolactate synthase large subunit-like protein
MQEPAGGIGVSMIVPGPGLQNASAGITNAYATSSRVLVICGQIERDKIGKDIGILHEINDQLEIIKPITKWQSRILTARDVAPTVRQAFHQLRSGRPRPVEIKYPQKHWRKARPPSRTPSLALVQLLSTEPPSKRQLILSLKRKTPLFGQVEGVTVQAHRKLFSVLPNTSKSLS